MFMESNSVSDTRQELRCWRSLWIEVLAESLTMYQAVNPSYLLFMETVFCLSVCSLHS